MYQIKLSYLSYILNKNKNSVGKFLFDALYTCGFFVFICIRYADERDWFASYIGHVAHCKPLNKIAHYYLVVLLITGKSDEDYRSIGIMMILR